MQESKEANERFDRVKTHLAAITSWLEVGRDDQSIVVDVGALERNCSEFAGLVDELLAVEASEENREKLSERFSDLWAAVGWIRSTCDDLEDPLSRCISALCKDGETDSKEGGGDR